MRRLIVLFILFPGFLFIIRTGLPILYFYGLLAFYGICLVVFFATLPQKPIKKDTP